MNSDSGRYMQVLIHWLLVRYACILRYFGWIMKIQLVTFLTPNTANPHWDPLPLTRVSRVLVGVLVLVARGWCQLPCHYSSQCAATNRSHHRHQPDLPSLLSWRTAAEGSTHTHTLSRPSLDPL